MYIISSIMTNKKNIAILLSVLFLSGCGGGDFLNKIFTSEESDTSIKFPGEYYLSNRQVCGQALDLTSSPLAWEPLSSSSEYVREAKRRNISIERCAQILGLNTD